MGYSLGEYFVAVELVDLSFYVRLFGSRLLAPTGLSGFDGEIARRVIGRFNLRVDHVGNGNGDRKPEKQHLPPMARQPVQKARGFIVRPSPGFPRAEEERVSLSEC
jgi:hypothetical protein